MKVWCRILNNRLIVPIFLDNNFNRTKYLEVIQDIIRDLPGDTIRQQDSERTHNIRKVTQYLNENFPPWIRKYIGISQLKVRI